MVKFEAQVGNEWLKSYMKNVLYVPEVRRNLFSVTSAIDNGLEVYSRKSCCEFVIDSVVKARGIRVGKLYKMNIRVIQPETSCVIEVNVAVKNTLQIWHERLGHQNKQHMLKFLRQQGVEVAIDSEFCGACVEGKQTRDSFLSRQQRATEAGEIIHADLCGPMKCASLGGSKYFLCFTCNFSRFRMVYFLKDKSEAAGRIAEMLKLIQDQRGRCMKVFQCDGGGEFQNYAVKKLLICFTSIHSRTERLCRTYQQNNSRISSYNAFGKTFAKILVGGSDNYCCVYFESDGFE